MANNIKTKTTIKSLKDLGSNSQDKHIKRNEMMRNILWDLILYLEANERIIDNTLIDSVGEEFREKKIQIDTLEMKEKELGFSGGGFKILSGLKNGNDNSIFYDHKFLDNKRIKEIFYGFNLEVQPMTSERHKRGYKNILGHYSKHFRVIQIKERTLQKHNWKTKGLPTLIHEGVHMVADYLGISDTSKSGNHNRKFQSLAMNFMLKTKYSKGAKHCSTGELTSEFWDWLAKNYNMKEVEKAFTDVPIRKPKVHARKREKIVIEGLNEVHTIYSTITKTPDLMALFDSVGIQYELYDAQY